MEVNNSNYSMKSSEIIKKFTDFFSSKGFINCDASPIFLPLDKSIMFVNAGMNQFKNIFKGIEKSSFDKAVSVQKCVRAGGKHNDLENVGYTSRHLTYFEMMGSFIFEGDNVVETGVETIWNFVTKILKIDSSKLWITVYKEDKVLRRIWSNIVSEERIVDMGEEDNFWYMGSTGPCGPCTEILFDRGDDYGNASNPSEDSSGERFLELWNIVMISYNRNSNGEMEDLGFRRIDTGGGLERLTMISENKNTVFETDRFFDIKKSIVSKIEEAKSCSEEVLNILADHLSCAVIVISDGVHPTNDDRGYVLKKILRRAFNKINSQIELNAPVLFSVIPEVINSINRSVPGRVNEKDFSVITEAIKTEEEKFYFSRSRHRKIFENIVSENELSKVTGEQAFTLKDTHGLTVDDILLIADDYGYEVDLDGFYEVDNKSKNENRLRSKINTHAVDCISDLSTDFIGYDQLNSESEVLSVANLKGDFIDEIKEGEEGLVILSNTVFYPEQGGQISDIGKFKWKMGEANVSHVSKSGDSIIHKITVSRGYLKEGDFVSCLVDRRERLANSRAHTATHLLQEALGELLGNEVAQAGSKVWGDALRFDFSFGRALKKEEIDEVELRVNKAILENREVVTRECRIDEIRSRKDIIQIFDDKYSEIVRLVEIGKSKELCCGTHSRTTSELGSIKILYERSGAAGVRRIEAIVGLKSYESFKKSSSVLEDILSTLKINKIDETIRKVESIKQKNKDLENEKKVFINTISEIQANCLAKEIEVNKNKIIYHKKFDDFNLVRSFISCIQNKINKGNFNIIIATSYAKKMLNAAIYETGDRGICEDSLKSSGIKYRKQKGIIFVLAEMKYANLIDIFNKML